jgi:hypothetical protein
MKIASTNLSRPRPRAVLSAYIDGKSQHIEALKLNAVNRLEQAQENSQGELIVTLDGQRHDRGKDTALFVGLGLAPAALAAYAGWNISGAVGAVVGGALGLGAFTAPAGYFLRRSLKAPQWAPETRWTPSEPSQPSPVKSPGAERLRSLVDENQTRNPQARQLLFLSGHGNRSEVADISLDDLWKTMRGARLDSTILDACLQGQLEVLTRLAPWAGLVLASPHKIKARGFDLEKMLKPATLQNDSVLQMASDMAVVARSTTPSFAVVDTEKLAQSLLPSLNKLGQGLAASLGQSSVRESVRNALRDSKSTDGLISRRVDLGSFLNELSKRKVLPGLVREANESFAQTVPFQENEHSISFHLTAGRNDKTLPKGWREFLRELDCGFKPLL